MALTEDFTFKLGDTGTVLNTDVADPFTDILRVYGLDSAPIRETERDHEGVDGGFLDAEFEKGRPMMLDAEAYGTTATLESYLDQLKKEWAPSRVNVPFYFKPPGAEERVLFVKPRGLRYDWEENRRRGICRVQFVMYAEDPRVYTAAQSSATISYGGSAGNGFAFNFGFNLNFNSGAFPAGTTVTNGGNRDTPAILTITGPITDPLVTNDTVGGVLQFQNLTLGASDTLTIDLANRTVLLNGSINRRSTLIDPDWFLLAPGGNFIRFGGAGGSGSTTLNITFRNAWR